MIKLCIALNELRYEALMSSRCATGDAIGTGDFEPFVSVVVPHFCDLSNLLLCLAALRSQTYPPHRFEVVVVDNGSPEPDDVEEVVRHAGARLLFAAERGAGPARNVGVSASRGNVLAFTDSDCLPEPRWLEAGVEALAHFDFLGGRMKVLTHDPLKMTAVEAFETVFAFDNARYVARKRFSVSANLLCARALFDVVGGFRTGVSEDLDWCHRAVRAGYKLGYAPNAVVGHPARRDWSELVRKWRRINAETYGVYRERRAGRARWLLRTLLLPLSAIAHSPRPITSRSLTTWRQKLSAVGILWRLRAWRFWDAIRLLFRRAGQTS